MSNIRGRVEKLESKLQAASGCTCPKSLLVITERYVGEGSAALAETESQPLRPEICPVHGEVQSLVVEIQRFCHLLAEP